MRIGILTYHRAENYGALLQAYAMRTFLQSLGHDVEFVDYWPDYHNDYFRIFPSKRFKQGGAVTKLACFYLATVWGLPRLKRKQVLKSFMKDYLGLPEKARFSDSKDICKEYDVVVYGSDQIWRQQKLPGHQGLDLWYYGSPNIQARKIAYAASMGPSRPSDEEVAQVKQLLGGFEAISVRESSLSKLLDGWGIASSVVVDPVFLLGREQWTRLAHESRRPAQKEKYILFYNLLNSAEAEAFANRLSKEHKLPIIEITKKYGIRYVGRRYCHHASIPDFLSLINNAEYVVSSSFHGVALSIVMGKQFYAVGMGNRADRVKSLLANLEIEDRYCLDGREPAGIIDYESVNERIARYSEKSKEFLSGALDGPRLK